MRWPGSGWAGSWRRRRTLDEPLAPPDDGPSKPLDKAARERIRGLIARLGGEGLADRDAAMETLARELPAAIPLLAEAAGRAEPEARAESRSCSPATGKTGPSPPIAAPMSCRWTTTASRQSRVPARIR